MNTREVRFQVAPVETAGSLAEQAKQAKKAIKGKVYRYRAFVGPEEDTAPLKEILKAPALAIVRVSALPLEGAKIVLEAVTGGGNNPQGMVHISGQGASRNEHMTRIQPIVEETYKNLDTALAAAAVTPADVMQITCYLSTYTDLPGIQALTEKRYPSSVNSYLLVPVPATRGFVECEATARATKIIGYINPEGLSKSPNFTHVVGLHSPRIAWSGLIEAKNCSKQGITEMFQRLDASMKKLGAAVDQTAMSYLYPNSEEGTKLTRDIRFDFYRRSHPPASTLITFAGVGDKNACTAVEVSAPAK